MDDLERLVDELCCGNHSLGDVYRYLLRVSGDDEAKARREFGRFLQGELPERLLNYSRRSIEADDLSRRSNASLARALSVHEGNGRLRHACPVYQRPSVLARPREGSSRARGNNPRS
jgi:hypothetical protein